MLICAVGFASEPPDHGVIEAQPYQPRETNHQSWRIKSFLGDAGLTGRFVFFVDFDRDGSAWIASAQGLYHYDGYTWTRFSQEDGLPSDFVRCVLVARDGALWIGTNKGIAIRTKEGRILRVDSSGLAGPNVRRIVQDDDGTLWFCSDTWLTPHASAGLTSYRDGRWTVYRKEDGLPSDYVSDYFRDSQGRRFVLTRNGLAVNEGHGWTRPLEAEGLAGHDEYFWSIVQSPTHGVIATSETSVFALRGGQWSRMMQARPELAHLKLAALRSGEVVALSSVYASPKRFLGWDGASFGSVSEQVHLPGEATYTAEAPDGFVWSVGYDLLLRWERTGGEWAEYPDLSAPLLADHDGRIWFAGEQTTVRLSDGKWESFPFVARGMAARGNGDVLAFSKDAIIRIAPDGVVAFGLEQIGLNDIAGHTLGADGFSWLHGTDHHGRNAVSVFDGTSWRVRAPQELQDGNFKGAAPAPKRGVCYLVSSESNEDPRLVRVDENGVSEIGLPDVVHGYAPALHADHRGSLWLFGHFGLFKFTDGVWSRVEDLPGARVAGVVNGEGETWFAYDGTAGGRNGLGRFREGEWSYYALDQRPRVCGAGVGASVLFGTEDALYVNTAGPGKPLTRLSLPVARSTYRAVPGSEGDVWVGLGDRVLCYRPDRVPPQTIIAGANSEIRQDTSLAVTFQGVERFKPRGEGTFTYSWRIGSGPWTDFGPGPAEGIPLSLGAGRYALQVRARDEGGDIDLTPARSEFRITAIPWPQRPWFWPVIGAVFTGLVVLGCGALAARNRTRFRANELERMVGERTAKLSESEARFRAMTAAAPVPFVVTRQSDDVILYANPLLGEMLGIPVDELCGRRAQELFGPPSERRKMLAQVQKTGFVQGCEVLSRRADGTPVCYLVSMQKMAYQGQPALIAGFHDITDRKRTAEELERARVAAEEASRAKSVFLANMTHEVRTPIMAMLSAAETASERPRHNGNGLNYAEIISRNGRQLLAFLENLLDFASMDTGKFKIRPVQCSLIEILDDVHSVAELLNQNRDVEFTITCEGALPRQIRTDPVRVKQALINLVHNALKFTRRGHVRVRVRMDRSGEGPRLSIVVEDTGPGIPQVEQQRIFEAFEQVGPRPDQSCAGIGLGLPLARWIAEQLRGTLAVESREGHGSTFTFCVATGPIDDGEWIPPGGVEIPTEPAIPAAHVESGGVLEGSVLLAEDAHDARELVAHALTKAGAAVTAVANGAEAVEAGEGQAYDLVLMDIRMPVMDGIAATAELRRLGYLGPVIALTASVTTEDRQRILKSGFDDLWAKPISLKQIVEHASAYLQVPADVNESVAAAEPKRESESKVDVRLAELALDFAQGLPARLHTIRKAVDNGDLHTAREILHQLAGSGGVMGFMPLSEEAGRVLSRIKDGSCRNTAEELRSLETLVVEIANGGEGEALEGGWPSSHYPDNSDSAPRQQPG